MSPGSFFSNNLNVISAPVAGVKEEPKSPKSPQKLQSSPKASFRPVVNKAASPSTCVSSTVSKFDQKLVTSDK